MVRVGVFDVINISIPGMLYSSFNRIGAIIKENAMHPQSDDFYNKELASYEKKKADGETKLNDLQSKKASRLSRKELLDGLIRTLEESNLMTEKFDEKLWRFMVESVTVGADGKLTFRLRNELEIAVE